MVAVILRGWDYRIYGCSTVRHLLAVAIGQNEIENAFRNPEKKGNVFRHLPASFLPTPSSCTPPSTTTSSTSHLKERDFCRILATRRTRITRSSRKSFKKLSSPGKTPAGAVTQSNKCLGVWQALELGGFPQRPMPILSSQGSSTLSLSLCDHYWNEPADKQDTNDKQDM